MVYHLVECRHRVQPPPGKRGTGSLRLSDSDSGCGPCPCADVVGRETWSTEEETAAVSAVSFVETVLGLSPLMSEVFIWHPDLCIGTRIDLLCINAAMEFSIVSIKTGKLGRREAHGTTDHSFRKPLDHITDSVRNRHFIQLLLECAIVQHIYGLPITSAYVVYTHCDTPGIVTCSSLDEFCRIAHHDAQKLFSIVLGMVKSTVTLEMEG